MQAKITLLPGDGIGPEVVAEGVKALKAVAARFGHAFQFAEALIGGTGKFAQLHAAWQETLV